MSDQRDNEFKTYAYMEMLRSPPKVNMVGELTSFGYEQIQQKPEVSPAEAEAVIRNFTFNPPFDAMNLSLRLIWGQVIHVYGTMNIILRDTGKKDYLQASRVFQPGERLTMDGLLSKAREVIKELVTHELDECMLFAKERVYDPHMDEYGRRAMREDLRVQGGQSVGFPKHWCDCGATQMGTVTIAGTVFPAAHGGRCPAQPGYMAP